jgi:hypothetical protein
VTKNFSLEREGNVFESGGIWKSKVFLMFRNVLYVVDIPTLSFRV